MSTLAEYREFLKRKVQISGVFGFEVSDDEIHPSLKPFQRIAVKWAVRGGRRALFEAFGLGKTRQQLEILRLILKRTGGRGLVVAPLGVRQEFEQEAAALGISIKFVRSIEECEATGLYITNYETVRDGKLDPSGFMATSLDEAAILSSFGGTKTFREFMRLFEAVKYKFVATATPDPNEYIELLAYADYLGVMDTGQGKTRFFKRDATKADKLTLLPSKEQEWWLWVASWGLFLQRPSDFGPEFSDEGYAQPEMAVIHHEVRANHEVAVSDRDGQFRMFRNSALGVTDAAREKRDSMAARILEVQTILAELPNEHVLLWHDLEAERHAIEHAIPNVVSVYGSQRATQRDLDTLEASITGFANGSIQLLAAKPSMFGAGANFQRHCHIAIFCGIGFSFRNFIQAIHRIYRFLQTEPVEIHLIYSESEREVLRILMEKWNRYKEQVTKMSEIIKEYGLSELALAQALTRSFGCERVEISGEGWQLVNNDSIEEAHQEAERIQENSIGLILTSVPFSTQYEYSPSYNDFGNSKSNAHFFEQMDFLTPQLYRALQPGRIAAIHVKDRTVPGGMTGMGFQEAYPFHADCIFHFIKHGFRYLGMKTIVTDVVRENNQTYRLGWTEQCKDGTKMGYGMPEYLLLFRKPQTDRTKGYADIPVRKDKKRYSKARWQVDAHAFTRSNGNRFITPEEIADMPFGKRLPPKSVRDLSRLLFSQHLRPVTFMLLQPPSWHPDVWTDITRMLTVNAIQASKGKGKHICPMQFDIADRVIVQMSNPGDVVLDPFSGLGTVPYRAVALGRKAIGIELNHQYFLDSAAYCKAAESKMQMPSLFDLIGEPEEPEAPKLPEYFHKLTKKAQAEWKRENGHAAQL
jgi:DNA modification methylase